MGSNLRNKKVIALIPARSGSKGVPDKNIRKLGGRALIELACDWCAEQEWIDDFYISTDSQLYADIAIKANAKFLSFRNHDLSSDTASSASVAIAFLEELAPEADLIDTWLCLIQPSSPIRPNFDIKTVSRLLVRNGSAVSVARVEEPHPYKLKVIEEGLVKSMMPGCQSEVPRQVLPAVYQLTGSIYIVNAQVLLDHKSFLVDPCIPILQDRFVNIDSEFDLRLAELMYF